MSVPSLARLVTVEWGGADQRKVLTRAAVLVVVAAPVMAVAGVPRLPLMWPLHQLDIVLPGCGLTRGVVALARGDLGEAWRWNPGSYVVLAVAGAALMRLGLGLGTGRWIDIRVRQHRTGLIVLAAVVAALWLRQQGQAELLISGS